MALVSWYSEIKPYNQDYLKLKDHQVYYEESGNPSGQPVIYLHGGPGGGSSPLYRSYFNPDKYRIILFDQRGCGKSKPLLSLKDNTTWDLVEDIERLRQELKLMDFVLAGGSWGSTLALSYATRYPKAVISMALRGVFLGRNFEADWLTKGASLFNPQGHLELLRQVGAKSDELSSKIIDTLFRGTDPAARLKVARAWARWEDSLMSMEPRKIPEATEAEDLAISLIEWHYFRHNCFFETRNFLLEKAPELKMPVFMVQGLYDLICPPISAYQLDQALPNSSLQLVKAGHGADELLIANQLIRHFDQLTVK